MSIEKLPILTYSAMIMSDPLVVLLVEDSDIDAKLFQELVAESALTIKRVERLADAHDVKGVDICVLDLNLLESVGEETVKCFRRGFPHIPCVVLSHINDPHIEASCLEAGVYYFLRKEEITAETILRSMHGAVIAHKKKLSKTEESIHTEEYLGIVESLVDRILSRLDQLNNNNER